MNNDMQQFRKEYNRLTLSEKKLFADPFKQFNTWFKDAINAGISEPNAMALATASPEGMPSVRMVLLKEAGPDGFVFFTNYDSRKGIHLANNPRAALLFFWSELERQVRIEGRVEKTDDSYSDAYFASRPFESQIGAVISHQSAKVESREKLEMEFRQLSDSKNKTLKRPAYWGGYRVKPVLFEFWQGREHRLHDRIQYKLQDNRWIIERLAP